MEPLSIVTGTLLEILDARGAWMATLTWGAYSVQLAGPARTFAEGSARHPVSHSTWVRTLPAPFDGAIDREWLERAWSANAASIPDVLAIAMEYVAGAAPRFEGDLQIAGAAEYGPLVNGEREEGADYNDYLGIRVTYPEREDPPESRQFRCLDCSGYMRMVWGYRGNLPGTEHDGRIPVGLDPAPHAIPRRAVGMLASAPGVVVIPNAGKQVTKFSRVRIGDLVFFDADPDDGEDVDHVGMYLGVDDGGHHRFISSRKRANGPTLGDEGGKSILDGAGLFARSFRAARRL